MDKIDGTLDRYPKTESSDLIGMMNCSAKVQ